METLDAPRVIVCRQCGHRLGHEVRTEHGQVASGAAVRFFKYATRPSLPNLTLPSSIFVMVANQMTHLADVYGVRHFELVDDSTGTRQAQLWLFTPRVKMSIQPRTLWPRQIWQHTTWPQQNSDETDAFILPAAKIFYQINGTEVESAPLQAQGSMRVERLDFQLEMRRAALVLGAQLAFLSAASAFNATARRANCTNADFEMELSLSEFRAADHLELIMTLPSGERNDGLSSGNASWVFTLYNGSFPILYPGKTYIDTGTAYQYVDCTPPATSTSTSATPTSSTSAGGLITSGVSTSVTVGSSATATPGNSSKSGSSSNAGAIAGGVVGGVLGLGLIVVLALWVLRRSGNKQSSPPVTTEAGLTDKPAQGPPGGGVGPSAGPVAGGATSGFYNPYGSPSSGFQSPHSPVTSEGRPLSAAGSVNHSIGGGWTQQQPMAFGNTSLHSNSGFNPSINGAGFPVHQPGSPHSSVSGTPNNPLLAAIPGQGGAFAGAEPPAYEHGHPVAPEKVEHLQDHVAPASGAGPSNS
ncbi:hypothetical protein OC845_002666 [Tilletia horrida]|nr:hypothetical protein OC845_002666 [Tilletia horrida]